MASSSPTRAVVAAFALALTVAGCSGAEPVPSGPSDPTTSSTSAVPDPADDGYTLSPDALSTLVTNEIQTSGAAEVRGAIVDCGTDPVTLVDDVPVDVCVLVAPPPARPLTVTPTGVAGGGVSLDVVGLD